MVILFGGSFDPVHSGHLLLIQKVIEKFKPDKFIVVPAYNGMCKQKCTFTGEFRLKLITKALSVLPKIISENIEISDYEIKQNRPVYTYETIEKLKPDALLVGGDLDYKKWKNFDEVIDVYTKKILVYPRNTSVQRIRSDKEIILDMPLSDISSSEIVNRLSQGKSIINYVPHSILKYIKEEYLSNCNRKPANSFEIESVYC